MIDERSSEGCGFDPRLGLRNRFLWIELHERSSIIQGISTLPHFQNIYLIITLLTYSRFRLGRTHVELAP